MLHYKIIELNAVLQEIYKGVQFNYDYANVMGLMIPTMRTNLRSKIDTIHLRLPPNVKKVVSDFYNVVSRRSRIAIKQAHWYILLVHGYGC